MFVLAVGADDAVARQDDRDRVLAVGGADRPERTLVADALGEAGTGLTNLNVGINYHPGRY